MMTNNGEGNTLYYRGMTINDEAPKLNNKGEKASCTNSLLDIVGSKL